MSQSQNKENIRFPQPRAHHYTFAHIALKEFCKKDPLKLFSILSSKDSRDFIDSLWKQVCTFCDQKEKTDIKAEDIKVDTINMRGSFPAVLITMPETKGITEAIMIAIVIETNLNTTKLPEEIKYRYFTLEHGQDIDEKKITIFCEWSNGNHLNMGQGPEAKSELFIQEIEKKYFLQEKNKV